MHVHCRTFHCTCRHRVCIVGRKRPGPPVSECIYFWYFESAYVWFKYFLVRPTELRVSRVSQSYLLLFLKGGGGSCAQCISLFIEHVPVLIIWNNNILPLEYFFWSFIWVEVLMYEASIVGQWWIDVLLHQGTIVHPLKLEGYKGQRCKRLFPCSRKCQNCLFEECYIGSKVYIRNLCIQRPLYFVYV